MTTSPPVADARSVVGGRRDGADDRFWRWTTAAVVVALAVRVAWVAWAHRTPIGLYDPARYFGYADQIAKGHGYSDGLTGQATAYYPPGYPWFLGVINVLVRHTPLPGGLPLVTGLAQAALGAATVGFVAVVGRRLAGPVAGVVAAFGLAFYPNLVFHTGLLLSETLYNFLFLAFLVVLLWRPWPEGLTTRRVAGAAFLLALAILVRPISFAIVPVLAVAWWSSTRQWRTVLRWTGLTLAIIVACIVPWTVRNAIRMHAFVPMSTNTGDNLCIGHGPGATGGFVFLSACDVGETVNNGTAAEVRSDRARIRRALRFIRERPGHEVYLTGQRAIAMFENDQDAVGGLESFGEDRWLSHGTELLLKRVSNSYYVVVAVAGVLGLARLAWRRRPDRLFVVLSAVATVAVPLFFFGDPRFKVPVVPLLVIGAGCAVTRSPAREDRPDAAQHA